MKMEEVRKEKGITVTKLCKDSNIAVSTYNRYLNGKRKANVEILVRLCEVLGITLNDLV
ncbi:MAG: helix-turn-helix domain-containing protein [Clostridium sp.]